MLKNSKFSSSNQRAIIGNAGENATVDWLKNEGFSIVARNYQWRGGEIDIIASKDNIVVFVEVKTRTRSHFALSDVITPSKQKTICSTALRFLYQHGYRDDTVYRFDVALVHPQEKDPVCYIPNAFYSEPW